MLDSYPGGYTFDLSPPPRFPVTNKRLVGGIPEPKNVSCHPVVTVNYWVGGRSKVYFF